MVRYLHNVVYSRHGNVSLYTVDTHYFIADFSRGIVLPVGDNMGI